jgi:hypothetical protein
MSRNSHEYGNFKFHILLECSTKWLLKVGAHLPSLDGPYGLDFIITYIVSNEPALSCLHCTYWRSAVPTGIPERVILSD